MITARIVLCAVVAISLLSTCSVPRVAASEADDAKELDTLSKEIEQLKENIAEMEKEFQKEKEETDKLIKEQKVKVDQLSNKTSHLTQGLVNYFIVHSPESAGRAAADEEGGANQTSAAAASGAKHRSKRQRSTTVAAKPKELLIHHTGGVSYIRWGRTTCNKETGTTEIYQGYAATGKSTGGGGGSDMICLHKRPDVLKSILGVTTPKAALFGVEYEFEDFPFVRENNQASAFKNNDMPCVMCHSAQRSVQLMIPGRNKCISKAGSTWTLEYTGFLVSTLGDQQRGAYTCLDSAPESRKGGHANVNGATVYLVKSGCAQGLSCPSFVDGFAIPCVVCSM